MSCFCNTLSHPENVFHSDFIEKKQALSFIFLYIEFFVSILNYVQLAKYSAAYRKSTAVFSPISKGETMRHTGRNHIFLSILLILILSACACGEGGGGNEEITTEIDKVSYAVGVQLAQMMMQQGITDVNSDIVATAIEDVLKNSELKLSDEEMTTAMQSYMQDREAKRQEEAADNLAAAEAFIDENAQKEDVVTLEDDLQYEVITEGTGAIPQESDTVSVHYHGTFVDGTVFDSSVDRGEPIEFPVTGVIPGWSKVLQMMKTGAKWKVYIPPSLAYGPSGRAGIPPNSLLIFEIELLDIVTQEQ